MSRTRDTSARLWVFGVVVLSLLGTLLGRLGEVQLSEHADYVQAAATVNTRVITEPAVRGRILDRNGVPLADNSSEAVVTVQRKVLLESEDGGRGLVRAVAGVLAGLGPDPGLRCRRRAAGTGVLQRLALPAHPGGCRGRPDTRPQPARAAR